MKSTFLQGALALGALALIPATTAALAIVLVPLPSHAPQALAQTGPAESSETSEAEGDPAETTETAPATEEAAAATVATEEPAGARPGSVAPVAALLQHLPQQIEVCAHGRMCNPLSGRMRPLDGSGAPRGA